MKYLSGVVSLGFLPEFCTGCGRCVEVCPHGVFAMRGERVAIVDRDSCIECGACAKNCAFEALSVRSGTGCATALINEMLTGEQTCDCSGPASSSCC